MYLLVVCTYGGGKQWQTTPKYLPRMQSTRAIPVAWPSSGLCPNRPKGWIPIIIMYIWTGSHFFVIYHMACCFVSMWSFISSTNGKTRYGSVMRTGCYEECLHLGGRKQEEAAENWIKSFIICPPHQLFW